MEDRSIVDDNLDVRSRILLKTSNSVESASGNFGRGSLNSGVRALGLWLKAALRLETSRCSDSTSGFILRPRTVGNLSGILTSTGMESERGGSYRSENRR